MQRPFQLSRPAQVDLDSFHDEMDINFSRHVDLSIKFLPHLLQKPFPTALIFTGSLLAAVPAVMVPAYSASKAALTAYVSCLRRQHPKSSTKIIEVWPPLVQSKPSPFLNLSQLLNTPSLPLANNINRLTTPPGELHDYMGKEAREMGIPVDVFTEQAWVQLAAGSELVMVGELGAGEGYEEMMRLRNGLFDALSDRMMTRFEL